MNTSTNLLFVAAAVIRKEDKVFIAQRKEGRHLAGYWEFPGGKVEPNEAPQDCLVREFREEFTIDISVNEFIADYIYHYDDKSIRLISYFATLESGNIVLNDHDAYMWVTISNLNDYNLAPADIEIVNKLQTSTRTL